MSQPTSAPAAVSSIGRRMVFILASVFIVMSATLGCIYLLFPCVILAYLSPKLFRLCMDHFMGSWFTLPTALLEWISGTKFEVRGDAIDPQKPALIVMNHRTRLDWLLLWQALTRVNSRLLNTEKITLKSALRHLPGLGWGMALDAFIFLERNFNSDSQTLDKMIKYFAENGQPYQILWFAEGTDMSKRMKERSDVFARANGLPLYEHCLHPRTTGFSHLVQKMREVNYLDCIYDVTIGYSHDVVQREEAFFLGGEAPHKVHFLIQKIPLSDLPESKTAMGEWLQQRWADKETTLSNFYAEEDPDKRSFKSTHDKAGTYEITFDQQILRLLLAIFWSMYTLVWLWMMFRLPYQFIYSAGVIAFFVCASMLPGGGLSQLLMYK